MFHSNYMKMCEDFSPNFGDKGMAVASRQRTDSLPFHKDNFEQKTLL
jgi:hypothetical protein